MRTVARSTDAGDSVQPTSVDPRRVHLEAFFLAIAAGPVDQAVNAVLGKVLFAFPIEPDEAREIAARARAAVSGRAVGTGARFSERAIYQRVCEVAWEDGDVEADRRALEPLRHALGIDPLVAEKLLQAAQDAPRRMPPEPPAPAREATAVPPRTLEPDRPLRFYRESGAVPVFGLLTLCLAALVSALAAGMLYGPLNCWVKIAQLNALLSLFMGAVVARSVVWAAKTARVRSRLAICTVAMGGAIAADYFGFVSWLSFHFDGLIFPILPWDLQQALAVVLQRGAWTLTRGEPPWTGGWLASVWAAELLAIVGTASYMAWKLSSSHIYCESCDLLYDKPYEMFAEPRQEMGAMRLALAAGDLRVLHGLKPTESTSEQNLRIDLARCGTCFDHPCLSVTWREMTWVSGTECWTETRLLDKLLISIEAARTLLGRG